jgi:molybdopterin-containing oxidoreductase family membrane subunit
MSTFAGSFGLFFTLFLLFLRFIPMVAIAEVKTVLPQADPHWHPEAAHGDHDDHDAKKEAIAHG